MTEFDMAVNFSAETGSPEETESMAKKLAARLSQNDVIALYGDLGSGKTSFVRGLARGLDLSQPVKSPSFSIINEYPGRIPLYHIDFYRLENPAEIEDTGWRDYLYAGGIVVIEWAERVKNMLPYKRIDVYFEILDSNTRRLETKAVDSTGN